MKEFLSEKVIGINTVEHLLWFAGIILFAIILQLLFTRVLAQLMYRLLKRFAQGVPFEKLFRLVKGPISWFILFISIYFAFGHLTVPADWEWVASNRFGIKMIALRCTYLAIALSFTWIILRLVDFFGLILMQRALQTESKSDDQLVPFLRESIKVLIVIMSMFTILGTIFHVNIASLVTGLGIGGLAVALAAKESIENLIGSFTIFLDKPFVVGDQVKVGAFEGFVEKIGFRSTRLRTIEKTLVTIPNKKMVDSELDNLTRRTHRRVRNVFGLTFAVTPDQIKKITTELQGFFEYHEKIDSTESRVRLMDLGASSINMLMDFYIIGNDPDQFLVVREEVNFKVLEVVQKNGAIFAYPTQTLLLQSDKKDPKLS